MNFLELDEFINLYDNNKEQLITVYKNLVGYADPEWKLYYLKNKIVEKLKDSNSVQAIIHKYIPQAENYETFEVDFLKYIAGIPVDNIVKLEKNLINWGLMNSGVIPKEISNYILEKNRDDLMVNVESYIPEPNDYSLIVKLFYFISLISKNKYKDIKSIKNHFKSSNISLAGIDEILYLLTSKYKIFSIKTFQFITSNSILYWISEYGEINIIIDLYDYILNKYTINHKEIFKFIKSLENNDSPWISGNYLIENFNNKAINYLCNLQLLDNAKYKDKELYKISTIGNLLYTAEIPSIWLNNSNIVTAENLIYVPYTNNPFEILKLMMVCTLTNPGDFLMIFNMD
ncbi:hypothetical protein [Clostridium beijerinckii]|uniref:hypothetical protein n=1 Tax=Clostridium beijerinckii TaxID=1520 RepID=UPI001570AFB5|nr:hypothetical protein [Clostridium beijerinckii]NRT71466.1 hypothetical protein [Clostridium beijerinckii]